MIKDGFMYLAALVFIAAVLIYLPKIFTGKTAASYFHFAPPVVLIYLGLMLLCTMRFWDLEATAKTYQAVKNPILYAMLFIMLLRCDLKKISKLGPKMLLGFFCATFSIGAGFILSYGMLHEALGKEAWKSLGALCGSWMGGGGNMLAIQAALQVEEDSMVYALVTDSVCATLYVMFLLWSIGYAKTFNRWTKADVQVIDEVGRSLEEETLRHGNLPEWQSIILLLGSGLMVSAVSESLGGWISGKWTLFDSSTWTVLIVTLLGIAAALTPFGKIRGAEEISNVMLYIVIALIASRADLLSVGNAPMWLLAGFIILVFHVVIMVILAKLWKLDIFTCAVSSLANIGGTATAPVFAGTYSNALVPVGIVMALLGYVIGTGGGLAIARIMSVFG